MKPVSLGAVMVLALAGAATAQTLPDPIAAATQAGLCPGRTVVAASYLPGGQLSVTCSASRMGTGGGFAFGIAPAAFGLLLAALATGGGTTGTTGTGGE